VTRSATANADDALALHDINLFLRELLAYADVLPADLAVMLRDYQAELRGCPPWRSAGIGDPGQYEQAADLMAQALTDGEWADGQPLDDPRNIYARTCTPHNFQQALRLLAARGEIVLAGGRYYPRPGNERP
jgi:hypothetical protein